MNGYLIAEEGPLAGMTIVFEEGKTDNDWTLGRDPDTSDILLEDPMVSRSHVHISLTPEGFVLENLSTVNPATQNGMVIAEPVLLKEGDIIQIGSTFFHFTEKTPEPELPPPPSPAQAGFPEEKEAGQHAEIHSELHFGPDPETRWLLKVISGPNAGAEFAMHKAATYLIGKDPNICDIVFQDLSVSRQHARLSIDESENAFIEDLGSRNGVIVNGELISDKQLLASQDLVALGTTTFLVVDRHEARETIISPSARAASMVSAGEEKAAKQEAEKRDWKEMVIPKRHLAIAGIFALVIFTGIFGMLSLFKSEVIVVKVVDDSAKVEKALAKFPGVRFSFNQPSGKLFLVGHVLTAVELQELEYTLKEMPFVHDVENTVVVDELVWQNMNSLLSSHPEWAGVSFYAPMPGEFVLRGYLQTPEEAQALNDYINLNFDYLDRLENQVVVEKNLEIEIGSVLVEKGFSAVAFQLSNGEVVFTGRIDHNKQKLFNGLLAELKNLHGIRTIRNFVVSTTGDELSRIDLSSNYPITGYSKRDESDFFVVINGRILGQGDLLDGMLITAIKPKIVLLEKEGQYYKINYTPQ